MKTHSFVSLITLRAGAMAVVRKLDGNNTFTSRLAALGLAIGSNLEVLQNRARTPVLIRVRGTRIALGRGEADKIFVEPGRNQAEITHD